jgi:hypothetical protein
MDPVEVTFDSGSLHFVFTSTSALTIYSSSTCLTELGFSSADHVSVSNVIESDQLCNLAPPSAVDLSTNLLTQNVDGNQVGTTRLAQIQLTGAFGDLVSFNDASSIFSETRETTINYIRVALTDSRDGDAVDLQDTDWSVVLVIRCQDATDYRNLTDASSDFFSQPVPNTK